MTMRPLMIAVVLAFCLAACGKHTNGRYDAIPVPSSISHRINAHGVRAAKAADGAHQRWFFMHADGSRDPVSGLPDGAQVTGINDKDELTGYIPAPGCKGATCPVHAFIWGRWGPYRPGPRRSTTTTTLLELWPLLLRIPRIAPVRRRNPSTIRSSIPRARLRIWALLPAIVG
jgi:hypothetical protein